MGDQGDGDDRERQKRRMSIISAGTWSDRADGISQATQPDNELAELTREAKRGSEAAFAAIFERFQTPLVNYTYRLVGDWDTANDLAQDTFLKAYNALPNTDESLQISPWLYRIATNTALDSLRRRKRITWVPFKMEMEPPAPQSDPAPRHALRRPRLARLVVGDLRHVGDDRRAGARRRVRHRLVLPGAAGQGQFLKRGDGMII